jgi:hypothetical protein
MLMYADAYAAALTSNMLHGLENLLKSKRAAWADLLQEFMCTRICILCITIYISIYIYTYILIYVYIYMQEEREHQSDLEDLLTLHQNANKVTTDTPVCLLQTQQPQQQQQFEQHQQQHGLPTFELCCSCLQ